MSWINGPMIDGTRLVLIDTSKCPVCKAGVIVPELNVCADCWLDNEVDAHE